MTNPRQRLGLVPGNLTFTAHEDHLLFMINDSFFSLFFFEEKQQQKKNKRTNQPPKNKRTKKLSNYVRCLIRALPLSTISQ